MAGITILTGSNIQRYSKSRANRGWKHNVLLLGVLHFFIPISTLLTKNTLATKYTITDKDLEPYIQHLYPEHSDTMSSPRVDMGWNSSRLSYTLIPSPNLPDISELIQLKKHPTGFDVAREVCNICCSSINVTYFISVAVQQAPVLIKLSSDEDNEKVESEEVDHTLTDPEHWGSDDAGSWVVEEGASPYSQLPIDALQDDIPKDAPSSPPVRCFDESIGDVWTLENKYTSHCMSSN
jgi:hypothetical protein